MKFFVKIFGVLFFITVFSASLLAQCNTINVIFTIQTDNYAYETDWTLTNENNVIVESGGYNYNDNFSYFQEEMCVDDGCYTFTIFDSFGDGICCGYGFGSYGLIVQGETIETGGNFNYSETTTFCAYSADCMNAAACNFNPEASTADNSLCEYPDFGYNCLGECITDTDLDGICNMFEVGGCTDEYACNFMILATDNDGSCGYATQDEDCNGNTLLPQFNNAPDDISVTCSGVPSSPTIYAGISSFASAYESEHNPDGNCYAATWGVIVVMDEMTVEGSCEGNYSIVRHWVATDCMERSVEHTQTILVTDNEPPSFISGTESTTISCPMQPVFMNPIALDDCSSPVVYNYQEESILQGVCEGEYSLYRLVTATDACGNISTLEQVIEVVDITPPIWSELLPEQVISSAINTDDFGMPSAEDLCSNTLVEVTSVLTPGVCPLAVQLTRTFIATDGCGNESVPFVQTINEDTDLFTFIESTTDAICSYTNDGSVNIETSGAVPPYNIFFGSNNPDALYPGEYSVTISDDNLCSTTLEFNIFSPPALQLSLESTPPNCTSSTSGSITAFSAGGIGDLHYIWNNIDPLAVSGGDYTVGVEDENGCTIYTEISVPYADIPVEGELEGALEVMAGDSTVYEYTYTTGSSYNWTFQGANPLVVSDIFAISLLWASEGEGFVCVQETNAYGCVGEEVCIQVNVSVGIENLILHEQISSFPNPTSGIFNCTFPDHIFTESTHWSLFNMRGSLVLDGDLLKSNGKVSTFDFSNIAKGSYILIVGTSSVNVQIN